jgi:hypothetical protein
MTPTSAVAILEGANQTRSATMPISGQIIDIVGISDGPKPQMGPRAAPPLLAEVRTTGGTEFIEISQDAAAALRTALGANLCARHTLPLGEVLELGHHEFTQRVQQTSFDSLDSSGVLMRVSASVEAHPTEPPGPGRHQGATTLAIRMDQAVATELFRQIAETFRRMGWPLPPTA